MEGIRKNSTFFYIPIEKSVFLLREKRKDVLYLKCYNTNCKATGKIINNTFIYTKANHSHQNSPVEIEGDEIIAYSEFMTELRQKITIDNPQKCFYEVKSK